MWSSRRSSQPGPMRHDDWAHVWQLLKPMCLEPVLHSKRSLHSQEEPRSATRDSLSGGDACTHTSRGPEGPVR